MSADQGQPVRLRLPAERPLWPGTSGPTSATPERRPGSIRRTSTLDIVFADGDRTLQLVGCGRDLHTRPDGTTRVVDDARLEVRMDVRTRTIADIRAPAGGPDLTPLVGASATAGFRRLVRAERPELVDGGTVLALLLDDVPVATLISAGSLLRRDAMPEDRTWTTGKVGVCAGWAPDGVMAKALERGARHVGEGPILPALDDARDPLAWHALPVLAPGSLRRRRRIDVRPDGHGGLDIDLFFRDAYVEPDGQESGVHEYGIEAAADTDGVLTRIDVRPGILPGPDCPNAVASAQTAVGRHLHDLRRHVDDSLRGTATCTHLNDALRSLTDVAGLGRALAPGGER